MSGRGCSSVGFGEAQELGPFLVTNGPDGPALRFNNFTWNEAANLLFLDSPVGVRFSYSHATVEHGDDNIARDARAFLLNWLRRFPQYRMSDVYIAGDGYAGHLAPQLAEAIYNGNQNSTPDTSINLKGVIVGNPNMNVETDFMGMIDYAWGHALISDDLHSLIEAKCDFSNRYLIEDCSILLDEYNKLYEMINMDSLYSPSCPLVQLFASHNVGYDPCLTKHAMAYFSLTDVQPLSCANHYDRHYSS